MLLLSDLYQTWIPSATFRDIIKFHENPSCVSRVVPCECADRQAGRQTDTDRQAGRQTQTGRQADRHRQAGRETDTERQAGRQTQTGRQANRQTGKQTDRQEGRQTDRHTDMRTSRQTDCKILQRQRNMLKHQITARGGTWPTTNSDLVAKHPHAFSRFIKTAIEYTQRTFTSIEQCHYLNYKPITNNIAN